MFNLIKYEWMKRWKLFSAGLVIFIIVNTDLMVRLLNKSAPTKFTVIFISVLFAMCVALFFDHLSRLYRSLFTEESVFYFTMPLSGYRLLGARILAVMTEVIAVSAVAVATVAINYKILAARPADFDMIKLPENLSTIVFQAIQAFIFMLLLYITFLLMVYLSMVLAKSIFTSIKYGKLLSFISFILITKVLGRFGELFGTVFRAEGLGKGFPGSPDFLLVGLMAALLFGITGYLMDRKINI